MQSKNLAALALIAAMSLLAPALAQTPAQPVVTYSHATPIAGAWTHRSVADGSEAAFANAPAQPQLTIRCTRSTRRVAIARPATRAAPFLFVWTSSNTRNLPASYNPATGLLTAEVTSQDSILDSLAFSRGRIAFAASGTSALVLPAGPEIDRVIEDCRV